jgi:hypothetical protein
MNFHQNIEQILAAATPQQKLIWNNIFLTYGERIAISQIYYTGILGVDETNTFVAGKLYLFYELLITDRAIVGASVTPGYVALYSPTNTLFSVLCDQSTAWDTVANVMKYTNNTLQVQNILTSRLTAVNYTGVSYVGYRIMY